jgi:hypothetical protein
MYLFTLFTLSKIPIKAIMWHQFHSESSETLEKVYRPIYASNFFWYLSVLWPPIRQLKSSGGLQSGETKNNKEPPVNDSYLCEFIWRQDVNAGMLTLLTKFCHILLHIGHQNNCNCHYHYFSHLYIDFLTVGKTIYKSCQILGKESFYTKSDIIFGFST